MNPVKSAYDWVLHWADTPYALPALFLLAFAEASFFPLPPDILLIAVGLSISQKVYRYAAVCTVGSVSGGILGYTIGHLFWEVASAWFFAYVPGFTEQMFSNIQGLFEQYNFWLIFSAGFTPIPYKIITIGAGVFDINFPIFVLASIVSRGLRFYLVAAIIHRYGGQAKEIIERNFNIITCVFTLLLISGFVLIKICC